MAENLSEKHTQDVVLPNYQAGLFHRIIEGANLEPGGKMASQESIDALFTEMKSGGSTFLWSARGAEVPFDYAAMITKERKVTSSKFGFQHDEKKTKRIEFHPMWIIRDAEDYSGRNLKQGQKDTCIAINANGIPVRLKKLAAKQSSPIGGPSAEYEYLDWESYAKPEDLFDTKNVSEKDLQKIWHQWSDDLTATAIRYNAMPRERKFPKNSKLPEGTYSLDPTLIILEKTAVHKKIKDEIMVGFVPAVIVGAVGVLGATFGVPERVSEFWGGRSATASAQSAEFGGQDISPLVATALQDECYKGPDITPPEHTDKSALDGVVSVTSDTPEVRVMGASARVWVRQGVHVEKVLVCGASAIAQIDGTVVTAAVFGAESGIQVLNSASVRNAVVDGSGAKIMLDPTSKVKNQIINGESAN